MSFNSDDFCPNGELHVRDYVEEWVDDFVIYDEGIIHVRQWISNETCIKCGDKKTGSVRGCDKSIDKEHDFDVSYFVAQEGEFKGVEFIVRQCKNCKFLIQLPNK